MKPTTTLTCLAALLALTLFPAVAAGKTQHKTWTDPDTALKDDPDFSIQIKPGPTPIPPSRTIQIFRSKANTEAPKLERLQVFRSLRSVTASSTPTSSKTGCLDWAGHAERHAPFCKEPALVIKPPSPPPIKASPPASKAPCLP